MTNKEIALFTADILDSKKASDIVILDISERSGFGDYFVIAAAGSLRQLGALCDDTEDALAQKEIFVKHIEGKDGSGWILMDYGDVIINLFTPEQRERYQVEKIWNDCPEIER